MPSLAEFSVDGEELISDIIDLKPEPEDHLGFTIIVDGCPVVGPEKCDLLKKFLLDKFSKIGPIVSHKFPLDDEKQTKGFMFITYENGKIACQAIRAMNNIALDKSHTFRVTLLSDFERLINGNLKSWLLNELCRDQFAVVHNEGELCSVYWNTDAEPILVEERDRWTDGWMRWSPEGMYLATMHPLGAILWGGENFVRIGRFPHQGVKMIDFSPKERFMVSLSPSTSTLANNQDRTLADVIIWDVRQCISRRQFIIPVESFPAFKWSPKDEYFACLRDGVISAYETKTFRLLDKKKIGSNIRDFSWSPTDNILAYWVPESDNTPARVVLLDIPSYQELCTKNLFSVAEIFLTWHEQGDFLAVQVLRCAKKKIDGEKQVKYMGTYMNFELVRMREKLYPVDQLEVKCAVSCFQWEPKGTRFAFLQNTASGKLSVAIYDVPRGASIREVVLLDLAASRSNELRWSPNGNLLVVASLKSADGILEFISANDAQLLNKTEHAMVSEFHWDPTGRYVVTLVSGFYQKNDNAIWFWNSVGRCLHKMPTKGLRTFTWRPRPPTLLSNEQLKDLKKNMSRYNTLLANEDRIVLSKASRELLEKRRKLLSEFNLWKSKIIEKYDSEKEQRVALRNGVDTDNAASDGQLEEEFEFLIGSVKETIRKSTEE